MGEGSIVDDIEEEAVRIIRAGDAEGVNLRLLGGLAVRLRSPSATHRALARSYPDIDFATPNNRNQAVEKLLTRLGYEPNKTFNLLNGNSRLLFYDTIHNRQIDIFVGSFEMCHRLPITERLAQEPLTLPLAELLLTKLQIVEMNEKDLRDIGVLLLDHELGESDGETINLPRLAQICAQDWGLWQTCVLSLDKAQKFFESSELEREARTNISEKLQRLRRALETVPKPLKWKLRAKIGERVNWYELPEEVKRS